MSKDALSFDPFKIFKIDPTFDINIDELRAAYFKLQQEVHPDQFMQASQAKKEWAQSRSEEINKAYEVLQDPVERGKILLNQQGVEIASLSPDQLMEVMELQEEIETTFSPDTQDMLLHKVKSRYTVSVAHLTHAFQQNEWQEAQKILGKLLYLRKIQQHLQQKIYDSFTNSRT